MRYAILVSVLLGACGGSVEPQAIPDAAGDTIDAASDAADAASDAAQDVVTDPCKFSNGAPICSSTCNQGTECEPCLNMQDQSGAVIPYGLCSKTAVKSGVVSGSCGRCGNPSHVCVVYEPNDRWCIDPSFCAKAAKDGFSVPCRWQDGSPWTPGTTIPDVACPANGKPLGLCGGGCGLECASDSNCIGRSPTHPLGICADGHRPSGETTKCKRSVGCTAAGEACLVHKVDAASQPVADAQGVCVAADRCKSIAAVLPGGVFCTGTGGTDLL